MILTRQEKLFIRQLIALRKRKEEKLQAQWKTLDEEQNNCREERILAYQLWNESRAVLVASNADDKLLTRNELTQLISDKRSQYLQERSRAESIDYWDKRVEQIEHQKAELTRQKAILIRGQEKLKGVLDEQ
ncbi:hypothetical protein GCM10007938_24300 [Vibrio zhanjiangensis]|uniref:Type III secretion protein n=1 Tax=Vibrio zhanjiangensis TaxID=1046128 RepID=A0ABQ6F0X0_9VIBR|nr:hypothetical protein [Vibrio zhanjiangensis]GLT18649.1 hypothetical protein GCM10007938_24300 [Vibrio zhanjiangensis]